MRLAHDTLAAVMFRRCAGMFMLSFVVATISLTLLACIAIKLAAPVVSTGSLLLLIPDAWVAALPVTTTVAACVAVGVVVQQASDRKQLLNIALMGRSPLGAFWPVVAASVVLSGALLVVVHHSAPEAWYRLRFPLSSTSFDVDKQLLADSGAVMSWQGEAGVRGDQASSSRLVNFGICMNDESAIVSETTDVKRQGDYDIQLSLKNGRMLKRAPDIQLNLAFEHLSFTQSLEGRLRPDKSRLLSLAYYCYDELPRYGKQIRLMQSLGVECGRDSIKRRALSTNVVVALRCAAASQVMLYVTVLLMLLAQPLPASRLVILAAIASIVSGSVVQVLLESRACKAADLPGAWVACLPALTTVVGATITRLVSQRTRGSS
jgi:hypothetical protein